MVAKSTFAGMKPISKKILKHVNRYDVLTMLMIAISVVTIFFLCMWYDHQESLIENAILKNQNY